MSESRGMRGITHQMEVGGKRLIVTVCHACEGADPALAAIPHSAYLGVMHESHRMTECHHPTHAQ